MAAAIRRFRCFSSQSKPTLFPHAKIRVDRGDNAYGFRQYLLEQTGKTEDGDDAVKEIASLAAHRNVVFGATSNVEEHSIYDVCDTLLLQALDDCAVVGDQPQALSSLQGLTDYVSKCIDGEASSEVLEKFRNDNVVYEAVKAIATGIPRTGHSVVGKGTHKDAGKAWEDLAKEFIAKQMADECTLYMTHGGELVAIELLADTNPKYLKSAGGAMARYFFVQ